MKLHRLSSRSSRRMFHMPLALRPLAAALLSLGLGAAVAQTLPQGGTVRAGNVTIGSPSGGQMTINQTSDRGIVRWDSFDIGSGGRVNVVQPSASSVLLNRVVGGSAPSLIDGALSANGRVFVINPAGVLFGSGAQVNVGGLVASALDMSTSNDAFMAGTEQFTFTIGNNAVDDVGNDGHLTATNGGTIALIGANVFNTGTITATSGTTALAAGQTIMLDFGGDGLTRVSVAVPSGDSSSYSILQSGILRADGGLVALHAAGDEARIEQSGQLQANSLAVRNGQIWLEARGNGDGNALIQLEGGSVTARGEEAGLTGGSIYVVGDQVGIANTRVDASGQAGGGSVVAEGARPRAGDPNSAAVYVGSDATLAADALTDGRGGIVQLQGGRTLRAHGSLSARGAGSGDGGTIRTTSGAPSGNNAMPDGDQTDGMTLSGLRVDTGAPAGNAGTWYIEGRNIVIYQPVALLAQARALPANAFAPVNVAAQPNFNGDPASLIADVVINNALVTSNVTVAAPHGEVHLASPQIVYSAAGERQLSLEAGRSVRSTEDTLIGSSGGPLHTQFLAETANDALNTGGGQVSFSGRLYTNGGNVHMQGRWANPANNGCSVCVTEALIDTRQGNQIMVRGFSGGSDAGAGGNVTLIGSSLGQGQVSMAALGGVTIRDASIATASGNVDAVGTSTFGDGVWIGTQSAQTRISTTTGHIQLAGAADNTTPAAGSSLPRAVHGVQIADASLSTAGGDVNIRGLRTASAGSDSGGTGVTLGNGTAITTTAGGRVDVAAGAGSSTGTAPALHLDAGSEIDASGAVVLRASAGNPQADALSVDPQAQVRSATAINLRPGSVSATNADTGINPTVTAVDATSTAITVGGAASTGFAVSAAELARMTAPVLVVGSNAHAGAITVAGPIARSGDFTLQNPGGNAGVTLNAPISADRIGLDAGGDVTQAAGAAVSANTLLARSAAGSVRLTNPANQVNDLGGSAAARFDYANAGPLNLGTASATGFNAAQNQPQTLMASTTQASSVQVQAITGDLTLTGNVSSSAGADLIADGHFQNPGRYTLDGAPWRVWSDSPEGETRGGATGSGRQPDVFGCTYPGPCASNPPAADNHFIYRQPGTSTVVIKPWPGIDVIRDEPDTYTQSSNLGAVQMCLATAPLAGDMAAQDGDDLAREWSRVRSRPNLSNCVASERGNGCASF